MIDVSSYGANHIRIFHSIGLSAHSVLLTRHDALELTRKLRDALGEKWMEEVETPDD